VDHYAIYICIRDIDRKIPDAPMLPYTTDLEIVTARWNARNIERPVSFYLAI
jgi:hypothetical protein